MLPIALWIDSSEVKIFKFYENKIEQSRLVPHGPIHHIEVYGKNHTKEEGDNAKFYHEVVESLKDETQAKWIILGSGIGHIHFLHHINQFYPDLAKNVLDCKRTKRITNPQIIAMSKSLFSKFGLLNFLSQK